MEKIKWPKTVPYFYPEMCLKGYLESGSRRCAIGWTTKIFVGKDGNGSTAFPVGKAECDALNRLRKIIKTECISQWNDSPKTTLTDISNALNQLTEELGYTEPIFSKD